MQIFYENNTKLIHRLEEYLTAKGISFNRLAVDLGLSNSYFSKMVKNEGSVGSDVVGKILRMHPGLNADWLLTGRGPMLHADGVAGVAAPAEKSPTQSTGGVHEALLIKMLADKEKEIASLNREIGALEQKLVTYSPARFSTSRSSLHDVSGSYEATPDVTVRAKKPSTKKKKDEQAHK
ncbi:MAG: helix-turn-helix domain-containing protein [Rikenellaceae bacterium]|nr:helix-turn-helix domain-containing protein [Rikenellaceae bacterium]